MHRLGFKGCKMPILVEQDLQIDCVGVVHALKFDQSDKDHPEYHDMPSMPRVDFIIEADDAIYFVEVKDPGRPDAIDVGGKAFLKKVANGTLTASLIEKYVFSFFFRWAEKQLEKSVHYVFLVTLESALLQPIIDEFESVFAHRLPNTSSRWQRYPLASWQVHNMETWNRVFPNWPITRLSSAAAPQGA